MIVSQLMLISGDSLFTITWMGLGVLALGLLFLLRVSAAPVPELRPST
jgi:hypothetical protein